MGQRMKSVAFDTHARGFYFIGNGKGFSFLRRFIT